jgi:hypothetical protein
MRVRLVVLIALMAMITSALTIAAPAWSSTGPTLAQETDSDTEGGGQGEDSEGTTQGENDEEGEGAEEGGATAETGPPWTYQMARIALVMLALTLLGVAFAYYRFVAIRRREGF